MENRIPPSDTQTRATEGLMEKAKNIELMMSRWLADIRHVTGPIDKGNGIHLEKILWLHSQMNQMIPNVESLVRTLEGMVECVKTGQIPGSELPFGTADLTGLVPLADDQDTDPGATPEIQKELKAFLDFQSDEPTDVEGAEAPAKVG